jgi:hypothetical protein
MKSQQSGWWTKREDGTILFKPSLKSPTYLVSENNFQLLRKAKSQEVLAMALLGTPLFAAIMLLLHGKISWQHFSLAAFAYALVGIWFQIKTRDATREVLKFSTISNDSLDFATNMKPKMEAPATLARGAFGYLFKDVGFTGGLFLIASVGSIALRGFGFSEIYGQEIPSQRLAVLLLFIGLALFAVNTFRSRKQR